MAGFCFPAEVNSAMQFLGMLGAANWTFSGKCENALSDALAMAGLEENLSIWILRAVGALATAWFVVGVYNQIVKATGESCSSVTPFYQENLGWFQLGGLVLIAGLPILNMFLHKKGKTGYSLSQE